MIHDMLTLDIDTLMHLILMENDRTNRSPKDQKISFPTRKSCDVGRGIETLLDVVVVVILLFHALNTLS